MAREYIDELGDGTINPETSGVDSQATDNGTHVKTLAPIYYTPATIANDGKATRETPVTIKSALDGKQNTLATQTAYSAKGTATKVPQITTNSLGQVTGITEVTISGVTPASHTHGNIANGGTLTDTAAAAAGNDYVVIRDADNAKIQTSTIKGTDVADAVSKKHSHSTLTLSTTAQSYDGSHTLALPSTDPYTSARTPASHASTATTYGIGTTSTYGHVKLATGDMNGATNTDGVAVSKNHTHSQYAPKASPALTGTPTAPTAADGTNTTQIATTAFVQSAVAQGLSVSDAMVYKGTVTLGATSPGGLTVAADKGHTYKVVANGNTKEGYVDGVKVEAGDMVICNTDSTAAATSSNYSTIAAKWDFVQGNTDGVVVGPSSAVSGNVVLFDGATGRLVKDGGTLGTAAFKNVDTTPTDNSTNAVASGGVKTALDGKVSSIKKNGSTITPSSGVADIGYMPVTEAQATATVQEVIQALRVKPGGRMGSVLLSASTVSSTSIPSDWYNYIWIPHRTGAATDDNQNFGTLILTPMTNTPDVYVIEGSNLNTSSAAYRIKRLGNDASFLYANLAWGGAFRTSLSPFDNYAFKSANCFFGAKPSAIRVEYSTDGGTTWLDYGLTDAYKQLLLSQYGGVSVYCGKNTHIQPGYTGSIVGTKDLSDANIADQRLRITICDSSLANEGTTGSTDRWLYCTLRRIGIYMSTQSATAGVHCLFERRTSANFKSGTDTWVSEGDYKIQGDSGWNSIPCSNATAANGITFGMSDSQTREIRFTIWSDKLSATPAASQTGNLCIYKIVAYSENLWSNKSSNPNVANYGSPYTVDSETGVTHFSKGITSGVAIPISSGGTGATTAKGASYNINAGMNSGDSDAIVDSSRFAFNYANPSATSGGLYYRTAPKVWDWIRGKLTSDTDVNISGNAATASAAQSGSALETAINTKQAALTINDSKPITIGTAAAANTVAGQAHTHDGITSVARASVTNIDISNSGTEPAMMTLSQVTNNTTQGTDPGDGYVLNLLWDNAGNWDTQIYVPNSKKADKDFGHIKVRYKNESSTWGDWEYLPGAFMGTLLTSTDDLDTISAPQKGVAGEVIQYYWRSTSKPKSTSSIGQTGMDGTTGLPTGTGSANLFVFEQSNNRTESRYLMQLMVCADNGIWVRRQFGGTWYEWSKVLTTSDITTNTSTKNGIITVAGTDKTVYVHPVYDAAFNRANNTASADQCWAKIAEMSFDITAAYVISGTWKVYCSHRYAHTGILEFHSFISASSTSATFGQVELKWIGTEPISFRDYNFCMVLKAKTESGQPAIAELWCQCGTSQRGISITEIGGNGWNASRMTNDRRWVYFNPADSEKTTKPVASETIQVIDPIPEVYTKSVYKEFTLPKEQISYIKINATSWHHQQMFVYSAENVSLHGEYILRSYSNGASGGTCQVISLCGGQYTENVEWYTKANERYIKFDLSSVTSDRTYRFGLTELSGGRASDFELVSELPSGVVQITPTGPSARKLDTARKLKTKLDNTADATFDGTSNQEAIPVTGTLGVANGGTGLATVTNVNSVLIGNSSSATGAMQTIQTKSGAFYATATNGEPQFGTLPIAQGGTGQTSAKNAANALLPALETGDDTVIETDFIIASNHSSGVTDTTKFVRRTAVKLWNYIKGNLTSVSGVNISGNAATATTTLDTSAELQVVGVQSSATSTLKRDSGVTVQGGAVKATTFNLGTNATITYNSTTEAIDFTFP